MRFFLFIDIARTFAPQPESLHPSSQGVGSEGALIEAAQMGRKQRHGPHRRTVANLQWIAADLPKYACRSEPRSSLGTPTPRRVLESVHLTRDKITGDPGVDGLQTNPSNVGDVWEISPLSNQQHGLYALKHTFIFRAFQRPSQPLPIGPLEAKFGWTLCFSHAASLPPMLYFSKNFCSHLPSRDPFDNLMPRGAPTFMCLRPYASCFGSKILVGVLEK